MSKKIKHIHADLLSEEEMEMFSKSFDEAEKRMDEKLMEEIDRRKEDGGYRKENGIWLKNYIQ